MSQRLYGVAAGEQGTGVGDVYKLKRFWWDAESEEWWGVTDAGAEIQLFTVFECDNLSVMY